jgi:hypothetical protein
MKHLFKVTAICAALVFVEVPINAGASTPVDARVLATAAVAVRDAAHAKRPSAVTNAVLMKVASPTSAVGVVALVWPLGAFANPRIAGFVTLKATAGECVLFPNKINARPKEVTCPAKGVALAQWRNVIAADALARLVNAEGYTLAGAGAVPTLANFTTAAATSGLLPDGFTVQVSVGTDIVPTIVFSVSSAKIANYPLSICVSTPTEPSVAMAFVGSFGDAPC